MVRTESSEESLLLEPLLVLPPVASLAKVTRFTMLASEAELPWWRTLTTTGISFGSQERVSKHHKLDEKV